VTEFQGKFREAVKMSFEIKLSSGYKGHRSQILSFRSARDVRKWTDKFIGECISDPLRSPAKTMSLLISVNERLKEKPLFYHVFAYQIWKTAFKIANMQQNPYLMRIRSIRFMAGIDRNIYQLSKDPADFLKEYRGFRENGRAWGSMGVVASILRSKTDNTALFEKLILSSDRVIVGASLRTLVKIVSPAWDGGNWHDYRLTNFSNEVISRLFEFSKCDGEIANNANLILKNVPSDRYAVSCTVD
jgi:hypothetical protein